MSPLSTSATPVPSGTNPDGAHPPADTFYTFYAVDHVYQRDADGNVVLDDLDRPVIDRSFPLEGLADAFRYQEKAQHVGKICVEF